MPTNYDAILIVSFGGPEGMEDVIPFLDNVLRGRNVPRERLLQVAHHYELFNGVSPINEQNRKLIDALRSELQESGPQLPIYWGNRNWHPLLADTLRQMKDEGIRQALAFVTSAYSSFSGCRQYLQNISDGQLEVGPGAPVVDKLRAFYNHPLFIQANVDNVRAALLQVSADNRSSVSVVFTAHSIPKTMAASCDYVAQLNDTAALVANELGVDDWSLVYQSRSGSPMQPWLGPDIGEHLRQLAHKSVTDVVVAPIGFVSDHMEVIYDLDVEAQQIANEVGISMVRAETAGTHPAFIKMIRELILERAADVAPRFVGTRGPSHDVCAVGCCQPKSNS